MEQMGRNWYSWEEVAYERVSVDEDPNNIKIREEECQVILSWLILVFLVKVVRQLVGFPVA